MKKEYEKPEIEIEETETDDVILASSLQAKGTRGWDFFDDEFDDE